MLYDGQKGKNGVSGMPPLTPPCIWFPYGRMGQSASEPSWDTTGGKFGPFAGQCFVGDQTKSIVMRVYLEKVNGRYQGACFPFRSGFECGVNRLAFGPDGSLYVGMTNRGWGSVGGKPYGLQRLVYTGVLPFEIHDHEADEGRLRPDLHQAARRGRAPNAWRRTACSRSRTITGAPTARRKWTGERRRCRR